MRNVLSSDLKFRAAAVSDESSGPGSARPRGAISDVVPASPESSQEAWNACCRGYDRFAEGITRYFAQDAARLVHIDPGCRVLDVATGTGAFAFEAAQRGARVLATDFSSRMISLLRRKCERDGWDAIEAQQMDGQQLALADASFQAVGSMFGLVFFPDPDQGLREMLRVLTPGGQAVVSAWAPPMQVEMMRLVGEAMLEAQISLPQVDEPPGWIAWGHPKFLREQFIRAGFSRVHVVAVQHVWTFDDVDEIAWLLPTMTPSWAQLTQSMSLQQRGAFTAALAAGFRERQGDGPFAMTGHGLIAVGTKSSQ